MDISTEIFAKLLKVLRMLPMELAKIVCFDMSYKAIIMNAMSARCFEGWIQYKGFTENTLHETNQANEEFHGIP